MVSILGYVLSKKKGYEDLEDLFIFFRRYFVIDEDSFVIDEDSLCISTM
jgi:hypothetical protein